MLTENIALDHSCVSGLGNIGDAGGEDSVSIVGLAILCEEVDETLYEVLVANDKCTER